ncbi:MAG TPA: DUF2934 domain-containing protein [Candidatus Thermoplasmatota archaeon]
MSQTFKPRGDNRRVEDDENAPNTNRPNIASTPRTVTSAREPNPTDAYAATFSPTKATGTGTRESSPTEDEIRRRAYEIYQSRGGEPGRESEDWAQAERELREKRKATR